MARRLGRAKEVCARPVSVSHGTSKQAGLAPAGRRRRGGGLGCCAWFADRDTLSDCSLDTLPDHLSHWRRFSPRDHSQARRGPLYLSTTQRTQWREAVDHSTPRTSHTPRSTSNSARAIRPGRRKGKHGRAGVPLQQDTHWLAAPPAPAPAPSPWQRGRQCSAKMKGFRQRVVRLHLLLVVAASKD